MTVIANGYEKGFDAGYAAGLEAGRKVPDGWKLVPVEPTQSMIDEAKRVWPDDRFRRKQYRAMLAAAPEYKP
jgi:flagellar biosynthesis/type III secretory pathway protein FliH